MCAECNTGNVIQEMAIHEANTEMKANHDVTCHNVHFLLCFNREFLRATCGVVDKTL